LNPTSDCGKSFYNKLKESRTIPYNSTYSSATKSLNAKMKLEGEPNQSGGFHEGEIIYFSAFGNSYLYILTGSYTPEFGNFEIVGNIILNKTFINGENYPCQFLLVEEKDDTPIKTKKSGNWKTMKMLKIVKALKRYRIVKRLKRLKKHLKNEITKQLLIQFNK